MEPVDKNYDAFIGELNEFAGKQEFTDAEVEKVQEFIEENREFLFSEVRPHEKKPQERTDLAEKLEQLSEKIQHQSRSIFSRITGYFKKPASREACGDTLRHLAETVRRPGLPAEIWKEIADATLSEREPLEAIGAREFINPGLGNIALVNKNLNISSADMKKAALEKQHISLRALGFSLQEAVDFAIENNLSSVNLSGYDYQVTDKEISALTEGVKKLRHIFVSNSEIRDVAVENLTKKFPGLETVAIQDCPALTKQAVDSLTENLKDLRHLFINGREVDDEGMDKLTKKFSNMETLDISGSYTLTDVSVIQISERLKRLRTFVLNDCRRMSDNPDPNSPLTMEPSFSNGILPVIAANMPQLERLGIRGMDVNDASMIELVEKLPHLQALYFDAFTLTEKAFGKMAEKLTDLQSFACRGANFPSDAIVRIVKNNPNLRLLVLTDSRGTINQSLSEIARLPLDLEVLNLFGSDVNDEAMISIIKGQPGLKALNLRRCHRLTDQTAFAIADHLKKLKDLDLGYFNLHKEALFKLVELPDLQRLNLTGCNIMWLTAVRIAERHHSNVNIVTDSIY